MLIDSPEPALRVSISVIVTVAICTALSLVVVVGLIVRSHRRQVATGFEGMVGKIGRVAERIDQEGMVFVAGALWKAISDSPIEAGERIKVLSGEHQTLVVEKLTAHKEA